MKPRLPPSVAPACLVAALVLSFSTRIQAQPAPSDPPDKARARALLKEGVRLLNAGQHAPALRKFEDAYAAFPSAKILVNIGTAQSALGRPADAANTYQRYLDSESGDAAQLPAVRTALADLDAKLGRLAVKLRGPTGSAGEVRVANGAWLALSATTLVRVAPGHFEIQARSAAGAREAGASGAIAAGEQKEIVVELTPPESTSAPPDSGPHARATQPEPARNAATLAMPATSPTSATLATRAASIEAAPSMVELTARRSEASSWGASRWTPLRYGAVAAGVAGVLGVSAMAVLALRARSMWNDARSDTDSKLASRAATQANLATGAGVLGVAALGAGTVLWFVGAPRDRESKSVTAVIDRTHVGLAVWGQF
jgi:hypothetical protein